METDAGISIMNYKDPEKRRAYDHAYYQKNLEKKKARSREQHRKNPGRNRYYKYGVSIQEFDRLLSMIDGTCPICQNHPAVCVDHNHINDSVRGLLCNNCNLILGHAKERPETLRRAADYLERHNNDH